MHRWLFRVVRRIVVLVLVVLATVFAVRAYDARNGPPLQLWQTYVPHELPVAEMDRASWADYMKAEDAIFAGVRQEVTDKLGAAERIPSNRYFDGSPLYPGRFKQDWNRSFVLEPEGRPLGAVVLLHGLTDAPYSLRHIAESYRDHGFVAIGIRMPGHGTVPAGLTDVTWADWMAATRLAVREARRRAGGDAPLHIVGYSNGGALAVMYALDAIEDPALARPDRIVLISPMIGITRFARFSGIAGWPAIFPAFAKAAWLSRLPEFNPFKYNSFPVNAARQSFLLSDALQQRLAALSGAGKLASIAPILTFQSVVDQTVSTRAVAVDLYDKLPANGSELVLFDLNRNSLVAPLIGPAADSALERTLPPTPRRYRTVVVGDKAPGDSSGVERVTEAGAGTAEERPLGIAYPNDIYSLSHVALPFPVTDGLYGTNPDPADDFGLHLGAMVARGERGTLIIGLDTLLRMSSNPFFPYLLHRVEEGIAAPKAAPAPAAAAAPAASGEEPPPPAAEDAAPNEGP
jgi:alpha-beta hydrolase superfamily lysophospholipase